MVSYESIPQFTNQLAYQSVFAPPGFSFESPFTYPLGSQSSQPMALGSGSGNSNTSGSLMGDQKQQLASGSTGTMPMSCPPLTPLGMDMDPMSSGTAPGSGSLYHGGYGLTRGPGSGLADGSGLSMQGGMGGMQDPWKAAWSVPEGSNKMASPSIHDLFPTPAIRLNTGDRFSQLLDQKFGMDQRSTSTAFQPAPTAMSTSTSAPPHQTTHLISQSLPYTSYMPSPLPGQHHSAYQSLGTNAAQQNWDRLAIESNLQDYNQVQISPDLVAPLPPASYFQFGNDGTGLSNNYSGGISMPMTDGSRPPIQIQPQHQLQHQQHQQQHPSQSPYNEYPSSTGFMSAPPLPLQSHTSPHSHSMSISNRSSPTNLNTQPSTPQITTQPIPNQSATAAGASTPATGSTTNDMIWQSPFTSVQHGAVPAIPLPRHTQSQPLLTHPSADPNTPYQAFQNIPMQGANLKLTTSPSTISHHLATSGPGTAPTMMGYPQSQSYPGPSRSWAESMMQSGSASGSSQNLGRPVIHSAPIPSFSQPLSRSSSSQAPWQHTEQASVHNPLRLDQIPTSFPPAPTLSKRSRSPYSQNSSPSETNPHSLSHSQVHSHSTGEAGAASGLGPSQSGSKRPKLSVSMSVSVPPPPPTAPSSQGHSEDDSDKKPIIACHTCRARKLKCDGARPKCHHCARRNEDGCVYDTVLRRRGPGKKTKTKTGTEGNGKTGGSTSPSSKSDGIPFGQDGSGVALGSRFEMSTERS